MYRVISFDNKWISYSDEIQIFKRPASESCFGIPSECSVGAYALECRETQAPQESLLIHKMFAGCSRLGGVVFRQYIDWSAFQPAWWCYHALRSGPLNVGQCIQHSWLGNQDTRFGRLAYSSIALALMSSMMGLGFSFSWAWVLSWFWLFPVCSIVLSSCLSFCLCIVTST